MSIQPKTNKEISEFLSSVVDHVIELNGKFLPFYLQAIKSTKNQKLRPILHQMDTQRTEVRNGLMFLKEQIMEVLYDK